MKPELTASMFDSYRAARKRTKPSTLAQIIANNYDPQSTSVLDYGCGYGDDVQWLQSIGFNAFGYDPYYHPTRPINNNFDVVMLSYVLCVIPTRAERMAVIRDAFSYGKCLYINILSGNVENISRRNVYTKEFAGSEVHAEIDLATKYLSRRLSSERFYVDRTKRIEIFSPEQTKEILEREWALPWGADIRRCDYGWRIYSPKHILPDNKRVIYLGKEGSPKFEWGMDALMLRNLQTRAMFHCSDFSYLDKFANFKQLRFLWCDHYGLNP